CGNLSECIALTHEQFTFFYVNVIFYVYILFKFLKCFCLFPLHTALYQEPLPLSHVKKMQEVYQLNGVKNAEVRFRWLRICVKAHWEEAVPLALKMATEQGRMKFTRPLFKEVYNFSKYSDEAVKTFKENRGALHPVTAMLVVKDLKING
uniref:Leukotriene A-4 hydrolase-like n=1 Tax=Sinocyclocheilus grahami TaxID=75366 RepID=A0A672QWN3_SINGR